MANQLQVGWVQAIETLLSRGWSHRRIVRTLGIDRDTVSRYARRARAPDVGGLPANAAGAPPGSESVGASDSTAGVDPNAARAPLGSPSSEALAVPEAPPGPLVQPTNANRSGKPSWPSWNWELGLSASVLIKTLCGSTGSPTNVGGRDWQEWSRLTNGHFESMRVRRTATSAIRWQVLPAKARLSVLVVRHVIIIPFGVRTVGNNLPCIRAVNPPLAPGSPARDTRYDPQVG